MESKELPRLLRNLCAVLLAIWATAGGVCAAGGNTEQLTAPKDTVYRSVGGRALRIYAFAPATASGSVRSAVLLVQGGAWTRGSPEQLFRSARYFAQQGFVSVVLEYRLADAQHSPVQSFSDVCYALAHMRQHANTLGLAPTQIALWGISSSAQLAAATATVGCESEGGSAGNGGPDALLLVSPVVDAVADGLFRDLMRGHGKPSSWSPTHTLAQRIVPMLIMQGDADTITPMARSQAFCDKAQSFGSTCELRALAGQGHVLDRAARDHVLEAQAKFLQAMWP